ncbi:GH25 family lysozyme [Streptomyces sp. NRRL F-5126]|uniref:GH25 family lysozyme n=1 Tax=Streptomyces sp. NRRL F-5126 TaxID=1463857 RepID=UPI0004CC4C73|nr:GH25 family lysozyme [Streptomyces sp. NRRL F-5126]
MDLARTVRRRSPSRRLLAGATGALLVLAGIVVSAPGTAAAAPAPHAAAATHNPDLDWMGSTIPAHEGGGTQPPSGGGGQVFVTQTPGMDVSHYQGAINWPSAYSKGARFVYMKATEGTSYRDPNFSANYTGSYNAGFIRGSYHFATPNSSSGAAQADYFVAHGGGWSKDGKTLPPMLDIEYGSSSTCWGLSKSAMVSWITSFVNEVHAKTTRWPTIYTTTDWWTTCTGNTAKFSSNDPLFIARYSSSVGTLPAGWPFYTFWQYADSGTFPGDQDRFNGPLSGLKNLANNT